MMNGAYTALVSPFTPSCDIDFSALDRLIEFQIEHQIAGLVPCGTTGESPSLSDVEHTQFIAHVVKRVTGRVLVIAGTGSNSTQKAIELSKRAVDAGANAVMLVMPYYNKPTQAGLIAHCQAVAAEIPQTKIVLYNVPGRTASDLSLDSLEVICRSSFNVVAIKEATGNILRAQEIVRRLGSRLTVLSGDDALTLGMMACGARGVVSVTSNRFPKEVQEICADMLEGRLEQAREKHFALLPVHDVMFIESNPGPIKVALAQAGFIEPKVRLPLVLPNASIQNQIQQTIQSYTTRS